MKKAMVVFIGILVVVLGCSGGQVPFFSTTVTQPCTVCQDVMPGEPSLICERIPNPCAAYKLISTAGQAGAVWEAYTIDQAINFMQKDVIPKIKVGLSYEALQFMLTQQIAKFNKKLGATYLILSSEVLIFQDTDLMFPKDQALTLMAAENFVKKLERLKAYIAQHGPQSLAQVEQFMEEEI
jgi:hypothetical protein